MTRSSPAAASSAAGRPECCWPYLLARRNVPVLLLEAHEDFEREFRGDTLAPATLEILDEPGFADRLLQLPHSKVFTLTGDIADGPVTLADFRLLKTRFPFIALIPQTAFLSFVVAEARRLPTFQVVMGASVQELVQENEGTRGVRYRGHSGWHEVRALLTVGADGRFSKVRQLARMEPLRTSPPMDVLWFRLPRRPEETRETFGRFGRGHVVVVIDRGDWQIGYVIRKDGYQQLRQAGLEALRRSLRELLPELADRLDTLTDWRQISLLSVESNRLRRWYRPGLLLIGDAARAMSPIGGVGINYAIQDAVVAANVLAGPLASGWLRLRDLAEVQHQRELPTRLIQGFQHVPQRQVLPSAIQLLRRTPAGGTGCGCSQHRDYERGWGHGNAVPSVAGCAGRDWRLPRRAREAPSPSGDRVPARGGDAVRLLQLQRRRAVGARLSGRLGARPGLYAPAPALRRLDRDQVEAKLAGWAEEVLTSLPGAADQEETVALDGKTLRSSRQQGR